MFCEQALLSCLQSIESFCQQPSFRGHSRLLMDKYVHVWDVMPRVLCFVNLFCLQQAPCSKHDCVNSMWRLSLRPSHYVRNVPWKQATVSYKVQQLQFFQLLKTHNMYLKVAISQFLGLKDVMHCPLPLEAFGPKDHQFWISQKGDGPPKKSPWFARKATLTMGFGAIPMAIFRPNLCFSRGKIVPSNGFCRLSSHSTSLQWWACGSLRKKHRWTVQHSTFGWRSFIHPNFCRRCSHSTSS